MSLLTAVSDNITLNNIDVTGHVPYGVHQHLNMSKFLSQCKLTKGSMFDFPIHMCVKVEDTTLLETTTLPNSNANDIFNKYQMEPIMYRLYSKISSDQEVSWNDWVFFSLDKVINIVESNKQDHFIEIASSYIGMGWIRLLSWDKNLHRYFIHTDGGENSFTQNDHFNYFHEKVNTSKGFNLKNDTSSTFTFAEFIKMNEDDYNKKMYKIPFDL